MVGGEGIRFIAAADSAQAVTTVYTASLLATLPIVLAAVAALGLRRASAEGRVLVWRSAIVALLLIFFGRQLPLHWMAWAVPATLATPLVALGRVQVTSADGALSATVFVAALLLVYVAGVVVVLARTLVASIDARRIARRGYALDDGWNMALMQTRATLGLAREVRLVGTPEVAVPMTWGWLRPVVVIPENANGLDASQRRIVLLHELVHVRASDWLFNVVARAACALYWFHPAAWWLARRLRDDCELACDARVIASGVRRSDYAELLVGAAERWVSLEPALALSRKRGLRARLAAVLDAGRDVTPIARGWVVVAAIGTMLVAGPTSAVQLAPSRDVLTMLMRDARWESRAYAVIGLARRADADSVAAARTAAERDPNPRVRAWARYALGAAVGNGAADASELRAVLRP